MGTEIATVSGEVLDTPADEPLGVSLETHAQMYMDARRRVGQGTLDAAHAVALARKEARYGQWTPWLRKTGLSAGSADRLIALHEESLRNPRFAEAVRGGFLTASIAGELAQGNRALLEHFLTEPVPPTAAAVRAEKRALANPPTLVDLPSARPVVVPAPDTWVKDATRRLAGQAIDQAIAQVERPEAEQTPAAPARPAPPDGWEAAQATSIAQGLRLWMDGDGSFVLQHTDGIAEAGRVRYATWPAVLAALQTPPRDDLAAPLARAGATMREVGAAQEAAALASAGDVAGEDLDAQIIGAVEQILRGLPELAVRVLASRLCFGDVVDVAFVAPIEDLYAGFAEVASQGTISNMPEPYQEATQAALIQLGPFLAMRRAA